MKPKLQTMTVVGGTIVLVRILAPEGKELSLQDGLVIAGKKYAPLSKEDYKDLLRDIPEDILIESRAVFCTHLPPIGERDQILVHLPNSCTQTELPVKELTGGDTPENSYILACRMKRRRTAAA